MPARASARSGSPSPSRSMPRLITVDSPPGIDQPVEAVEPGRGADLDRLGPELTQQDRPRGPRSRPGGRERRCAAGRPPASPAAAGEELLLVELARLEAEHRLAQPLARARDALGVRKWVVASTIARARTEGSEDLKIPEPTNTPSAPSCIISGGVGRRRDPARAEEHDREAARLRRPPRTRSSGARELLGRRRAARPRAGAATRRSSPVISAHVAHRLDDVARSGLALGADHRRALRDPAQRLAEVGRPAHERRP